MSSLQEHLDRHDLGEVGVAFRRDCPVCRAERVLGQLPSASLVSPRTCAAVTALALVTSSAAPGSVLADGQGVAVPAPPSPPPPPANVQAAGAGAAPADVGSAPAEAPATSEHDDHAPAHPARACTLPRGAGVPTAGAKRRWPPEDDARTDKARRDPEPLKTLSGLLR